MNVKKEKGIVFQMTIMKKLDLKEIYVIKNHRLLDLNTHFCLISLLILEQGFWIERYFKGLLMIN